MNVEELKSAVAQALASVRELTQQLATTDAEVEEKMSALDELDAKRSTASEELKAACDPATVSAARSVTELKSAGEAAREALAAARTSVLTNAEGSVKALGESAQALLVLGGRIDEADVEVKERLADVEREILELASQAEALTQEVEQATQEADRLLQEEAQTLQRCLQEVDARVEQVRETIRAEATAPIAEDEQTTSVRIDDILHAVGESFELAEAHAKDSATYCVAERDRQFDEALSLLQDAAKDVTQALKTLGQRTGQARQTAVEAAAELDKILDQESGGVDGALRHIDGVLDALGTLGFTI
jgi:SMC interacting uncharacterized protein involved in chromosome segregation